MAVYTHVGVEELARFLEGYALGDLLSAKGIAEGVENSNYLIETAQGRFILTLYEKRVKEVNLPYFLALMTHLADKGLPVPRPIADRTGITLQRLNDRPACLIEFLPGVSVIEPLPVVAYAAGEALGRMHIALKDFLQERRNDLNRIGWYRLAKDCGERLDEIAPSLAREVEAELSDLEACWPHNLAHATIHSDLFPDNVLVLGERVTGLIDFYFACTDIRAYDLAVMHTAWCFSPDGHTYYPDRAEALIAGYRVAHPLTEAEIAAFATLCRGASLRFLLTRAYDWLHTPADALVTRKDPLAYQRRMLFYRQSRDLGL